MLYSGSRDGRGVWGRMDIGICMAESFPCSPEAITTLLTGYTTIQNKRLFLKKAPGLHLEMLFHQLASLSCLNLPLQQK